MWTRAWSRRSTGGTEENHFGVIWLRKLRAMSPCVLVCYSLQVSWHTQALIASDNWNEWSCVSIDSWRRERRNSSSTDTCKECMLFKSKSLIIVVYDRSLSRPFVSLLLAWSEGKHRSLLFGIIDHRLSLHLLGTGTSAFAHNFTKRYNCLDHPMQMW